MRTKCLWKIILNQDMKGLKSLTISLIFTIWYYVYHYLTYFNNNGYWIFQGKAIEKKKSRPYFEYNKPPPKQCQINSFLNSYKNQNFITFFLIQLQNIKSTLKY